MIIITTTFLLTWPIFVVIGFAVPKKVNAILVCVAAAFCILEVVFWQIFGPSLAIILYGWVPVSALTAWGFSLLSRFLNKTI